MDSNPGSNSIIIRGDGSNMMAAAEWSWAEDKIFENALVMFPEDLPDRWEKIARCLPGKSPGDVIAHYEILLQDVADIEGGNIEVPKYPEWTESCRNVSNPGSNSIIIRGDGSNMMAAAEWSWAEDKIFKDALVMFPEDLPDRWEKIARCLPGKSPGDVIAHYEILLQDVADIEGGNIEVPNYPEWTESCRNVSNRSQCERKKGKPWTIKEHMLFLQGMEIYGKSDWRSISRNVVISRLPSQVASHAQKFFNRQKPGKKDSKRSSIHDLTSISDCLAFLESSNASTSALRHSAGSSSASTPSP